MLEGSTHVHTAPPSNHGGNTTILVVRKPFHLSYEPLESLNLLIVDPPLTKCGELFKHVSVAIPPYRSSNSTFSRSHVNSTSSSSNELKKFMEGGTLHTQLRFTLSSGLVTCTRKKILARVIHPTGSSSSNIYNSTFFTDWWNSSNASSSKLFGPDVEDPFFDEELFSSTSFVSGAFFFFPFFSHSSSLSSLSD